MFGSLLTSFEVNYIFDATGAVSSDHWLDLDIKQYVKI